MRTWIDRIRMLGVVIGIVIQELRRGATLTQLTDCMNEMADSLNGSTGHRDLEPYLIRAIQRGHRAEDLRRKCDPRSGQCLKCVAVYRVLVRTYFGAESPPAPGSSWYPGHHAELIDAELEAIGGAGASCDGCRVLWKPPSCGCRPGGTCNLPAAGVSS